MGEREPRGVEELPLQAEVSPDAVRGIAGDRQVDRGEMDADLMGAASLEPDAEERMARQELLELEVGHRRARRVGVEGVAEPVVPVPPDRRVDRAPPRLWLSDDEREVLARQPPPPDEPLQPLEGLV